MALHIDYYASLNSPWTHLGAARIEALVAKHGASMRIHPVDFGTIFPASGGLPLPKRAPQRQAYRLVELRRFADHLKLPLNLHPAHFPVSGDASARLILAVDQHDGTDAAMALTGAVLRGVWADERNIADAGDLAAMLKALGLPERRLDDAADSAVNARYEANTQRAIELQVFGSPSYVIEGELFWGQDRLDFVERRLAASRS